MERVVTITSFEVPDGREEEALATWEAFAAYFHRQPGYLSTTLHQALGDEARFHLVSVSEWESSEHFAASLRNPELTEIAERAPADIRSYPGAYRVMPLSDTCEVIASGREP